MAVPNMAVVISPIQRVPGPGLSGAWGVLGLACLALWSSVAFGIDAPPAGPKLSFPAASSNTVTLQWSEAGQDAGYIVESRDSLFGTGEWLPAPASVWPISPLTWS